MPTINRTNGNDKKIGTSSHDIINLLRGNDTGIGTNGNDVMEGGAGEDKFVFQAIAEIYNYGDIIRDFQKGTDRINVSSINANTGTTGNQSFVLTGAWAGSAYVDPDEIYTHQRNGYTEVYLNITAAAPWKRCTSRKDSTRRALPTSSPDSSAGWSYQYSASLPPSTAQDSSRPRKDMPSSEMPIGASLTLAGTNRCDSWPILISRSSTGAARTVPLAVR